MIETKRLTLAPISEEDLPFLVAPAADGETSWSTPSSSVRPEDATKRESMETNVLEKRAWLYLATLYGLLLPVWILGVALPAPYDGMAYTALWGLLFFILFPGDLDLTARALVSRYGRFGAPASLRLFSPVEAILLHGIAWGVAHAPLIWFGFNYGTYRNERVVGRRRDSLGENKERSDEGVA